MSGLRSQCHAAVGVLSPPTSTVRSPSPAAATRPAWQEGPELISDPVY